VSIDVATVPPRRSASPDETQSLGEALAARLRVGDVLLLQGPLGAGKTCFVSGLARGLAVTGRVRSPSFTLINEYGGEPRLFHLDLYRLTEAEAVGLGLQEMIERGVLAVEWGERLPVEFAADALRLDFEIASANERVLVASGGGPRGRALLEAWKETARVVGTRAPGPSEPLT
jgi:tRNA threonylcarbamoyladenosine biosynthesis protein TsaE